MTDRYHTANYSLHVTQSPIGYTVWLNNHDIDFSGLCVGTGKTRSQAVQAAISTLQTCIDVLERPPASCQLCEHQPVSVQVWQRDENWTANVCDQCSRSAGFVVLKEGLR